MKKVLWLASWYPNKISPLNGDFIQRHAEATSIYEPIHVIFVVKDEFAVITDDISIENFARGSLTECIAYYKPFITGLKPLDRLISIITYLRIFNKLIGVFIKANGTPALVHLHVVIWAGLLALWLKTTKGVPYLVTEHWTGYHRNATENIYNKGWFFKYMSKKIIRATDLLLPDSYELGTCIYDNILPVKFMHVSNVVNTLYFNTPGYNGKEFRFIHVSAMGPQKNAEGLLRAFFKLLQSHSNCVLIMAGPSPDSLQKTALELDLKHHVKWLGAITYTEVAAVMAKSSALVLFSKYENQPCVILEALCSGLPVIATDVGGIPEVITSENGILIKSENEKQLLQAMTAMVEGYESFDRIRICESAKEKYNYKTIGGIISRLYGIYFKS